MPDNIACPKCKHTQVRTADYMTNGQKCSRCGELLVPSRKRSKSTDTRTQSLMDWIVPLVLVPPAIGYILGWLVGASHTPVVSTIIPLIFGLLGAVSLQFVRKQSMAQEAARRILSSPVLESVDTQVREHIVAGIDSSSLGTKSISRWLPTVWGAGALLFCWCFYLGTNRGVAEREPAYPELASLMKDVSPTTAEFAAIYRLRWYLMSIDLPASEFQPMFTDLILPVLKSTDPEEARKTKLQSIMTVLTHGQSETADSEAPAVAEMAPTFHIDSVSFEPHLQMLQGAATPDTATTNTATTNAATTNAATTNAATTNAATTNAATTNAATTNAATTNAAATAKRSTDGSSYEGFTPPIKGFSRGGRGPASKDF